MSSDKFEKLSQREQESLIMPEIIKSLRKLGGRELTKNIREDILMRDNVIPESFITKKTTSQRGREYRPFDYVFNFSVRNLDFSGFLTRPKRGEVGLTKMGREFDLGRLDLQCDIYDKVDTQLVKRRK